MDASLLTGSAKRFCSQPLAALAIVSLLTQAWAANQWSVTSPNGEVEVQVQLTEGGRLSYRLEHGKAGQRSVLLADAPLGLRLEGNDLAAGLAFESARTTRTIEETYVMPHGKRRECRNWGNELVLSFKNQSGFPLELQLRAYNDGAAFRYVLPGQNKGRQVLESEATGFALPSGARFWCAPSDKASTYSPAYETYYGDNLEAGAKAPLGLGWSFPMLFHTGDGEHWGLLTEADVKENFCGCRLSTEATNGFYSVTLPSAAEGNGQGSPRPASTLPWQMPWRVIIAGNSPGALIESTLVTDVSAPSRVPDTSWIRPGRVAWSWWSDNPSPQDGLKQRKFVDLAAEMGWEYVLVDANWTVMDNGNIHDVLRHAKDKGVGVLLWYNSGGPHNVVTEKPRDCLTYAPVRQFELKLLREWGVKGVKVDFFQSDKQDVIGLYRAILQDAAEQKIMVNFHGCTLPRGWERTYPHLMSMEAVRGEECYIFDPKYPENAPVQNTILPFTRNAVGPMDYTPVGFSDNRYPHKTSWAHELALSVLFESGWLHFTDKAEAYLDLPAEPKKFLKEVPVVWDDTRFVAGYPGQFAVLARRNKETWYIAGVNGQKQARKIEVRPGKWLAEGKYELTVIRDGPKPRSFETEKHSVKSDERWTVNTPGFGGFVATLKKRE